MSELVPDLIEPIVGYRIWQVAEHTDDELTSMNHGKWPAGEALVAACRPSLGFAHRMSKSGQSPAPCQRPPTPGCSCGVYAYRRRSQLNVEGDFWGRPIFFGAVALWGRVIRHRHGYRAQFAYPLSLGTTTPMWEVPWCGTGYDDAPETQLFESPRLRTLRRLLDAYGCQLDQASVGVQLRWDL